MKLKTLSYAAIAAMVAFATACSGNKSSDDSSAAASQNEESQQPQEEQVVTLTAPADVKAGVKLAELVDARYAVVTVKGICQPETKKLYILGPNDEAYATNVEFNGTAWTNVTNGDSLNELKNEFDPVDPATFSADAEVGEAAGSLKEAENAANAEYNQALQQIKTAAKKVMNGSKSFATGQCASSMRNGLKFYESWEYATEFDVSIGSVSVSPVDLANGVFSVSGHLTHGCGTINSTMTFVKEGDTYKVANATGMRYIDSSFAP